MSRYVLMGMTCYYCSQVSICQDDNQDCGQNTEYPPEFAAYSSPLDWFPMLRLRRQQQPLSNGGPSSMPTHEHTTSTPSSASTSTPIDLRTLRLAHMKFWLADPLKQICQYEIPGGGECRDHECDSLHLSRLPATEPTGTQIVPPHMFANAYIGSFPCLFCHAMADR